MLNEAWGFRVDVHSSRKLWVFLLHPLVMNESGSHLSLSPSPSSKQPPFTTTHPSLHTAPLTTPPAPARRQISCGSLPQVSLKIALRGRESGFGKCDLSSQLRRNVHNKLLSGLNCSVKWQSLPRQTGPEGPAILHLLITVAMEKATISLEKAP